MFNAGGEVLKTMGPGRDYFRGVAIHGSTIFQLLKTAPASSAFSQASREAPSPGEQRCRPASLAPGTTVCTPWRLIYQK